MPILKYLYVYNKKNEMISIGRIRTTDKLELHG